MLSLPVPSLESLPGSSSDSPDVADRRTSSIGRSLSDITITVPHDSSPGRRMRPRSSLGQYGSSGGGLLTAESAMTPYRGRGSWESGSPTDPCPAGSPGSTVSSSPDDMFCCLLCIGAFRNPKLFECQHIFCEHCLHAYYRTFQCEQYEQTGVFIPCPTCRKLTKVPPNGLSGLDLKNNNEKMTQIGRKMSSCPTGGMMQRCDICVYNRRLEESEFYCNKCALNLCGDCKTSHNDQQLFNQHTVVHISTKETINLYCDKHNKLNMAYFCQSCGVPACAVCIMHEHGTHTTMKLTEALVLRRDNVKTLLNNLGPHLDKTEAKLKRLSFLNAMHISKSTTPPTILESPGAIPIPSSAPEQRKVSVYRRPDADAAKVEQDCRVYYCQIERIKKLYDLATKTLEMSQSKKLLAIYEEIVSRLSSASDVEVAFIETEVQRMLGEKENLMQELLSVASTNPVGSAVATNGHTAEHANSISSTETESSSIEDSVFSEKIHHSLLIRPKLLWKQEKQRSDPGELWNPCDIAFLPEGNVVVAEYDIMNDKNNRLRIFDSVGKTIQTMGSEQIKPLGVTVTRDGNIAVTDCKGKRIKIFTPSGQLMSEWGKGQFGWPYGITCNSKGQFIVTDAFNDTVSVHQPDGKRVRQFGSSGSGVDQFRNPYHVAVDRHDNIIVSDSGNHAFKVFDPNGKFMFRSSDTRSTSQYIFDTKRKRGRKLRAPRGITVDLRGNIIVADDNFRVCMFDGEGKYIRNILTDEDSVKYPESLATNASGALAVTEWNPHNMFAVKVFNLYE